MGARLRGCMLACACGSSASMIAGGAGAWVRGGGRKGHGLRLRSLRVRQFGRRFWSGHPFWLPVGSLGLSRSHSCSLGLSRSHSCSIGLSRSHSCSLGLSRSLPVSFLLSRSLPVSPGRLSRSAPGLGTWYVWQTLARTRTHAPTPPPPPPPPLRLSVCIKAGVPTGGSETGADRRADLPVCRAS